MKRVDHAGRDVTDLPGLWDGDDTIHLTTDEWAELATLRDALRSIVDFEPLPDPMHGPYDQIAYHARMTARAALRCPHAPGGPAA
jgi:hypothetical protein